mmetsp:Transcript_92494/g.211744  ORF Transcript_92494/g.211744 Transcript_92494/m.211744 type:complete len:555 (-) Transcript_92494:33-1697(-)
MKTGVLAVFGASAAVLRSGSLSGSLDQVEVEANRPVLALAQAQARFWKDSGALQRVSLAMNTSQTDTAEKVDEFLRNQVASDHTCHAKLYRYKNMLNHLHEDVNLVYSKEKALVETITIEEAVISDLQTQIQHVVEEGKRKMKECKDAKAAACAEFETYSKELEELKQIGHSPTNPIALFQTVVKHARRGRHQIELLGMKATTGAALATRRVVASSRALQECLAGLETRPQLSALQLSQDTTTTEYVPSGETVSDHQFDSTVTFGPQECERERKKLEDAWRHAYMTIEELVETNEATCKDDTCEATVQAELDTALPPLHTERSERIDKVRLAQHELVGVRSEMTALENSLTKLEKATKTTQEACGAAEEGSEYLEKVRDLLQGMKRCPGLSGAVFEIPHFKSVAKVLSVDITKDTDEQLDAKLMAACKEGLPEATRNDTRAASQGELRQRLVANLPEGNEEDMPLYGVCPGCQGEAYQGAVSGSYRRCFPPQAKVAGGKGESKQCNDGFVLAVCVSDLSLGEHQETKAPAQEQAPPSGPNGPPAPFAEYVDKRK